MYTKDGDGNAVTLWTFGDVRIGNNYRTDLIRQPKACYLPNSPTAKAISSESATPGLSEQGNIVMRNNLNAYIISPLYTNGVGTIYFDAVNDGTVYPGAGYYKIKVEVSVDGGVNYKAYPMKPFKREDSTSFVADQTDTTELSLDIQSGGKVDNFYRVAVPVNNGGNVQFRIVRTSRVPITIWGEDDAGFILLDNILVSYPKSTASLESHGSYDSSLTGRQVLGWGGAMSVPFPAVGDAVYARAKAVVDTNVNAHMPVEMPISWAQMHYRWRYLDQQTNGWQTISLRPTADFSSVHPMVIPSREGDVEFWYDYVVQVPAYKYYDYTSLGLDLNGSDGKPLYSEEVTTSTNTQSAVVGHTQLPSGGKDWFFRLRRGKSDFESFTVYAQIGETGEVKAYPMSLSGNHLWRGLCPTREEVADGLRIRIVGRRYDENGDTDYPIAVNRFSLAGNAATLPATDMLSPRLNDDGWEWFTVPCDAKTGYVLIQLQDDTLAYTVVHADYQDFNGWTDANKSDGKGLFVGTSSDPNSTHMSGTTPEAVTYPSNFSNWNETIASNAYWTEVFYATKAELDAGLWPLYEPFERSLSPNTGFAVENGQWVNGFYRDNGQGMAFQMEGRGKGLVQFVNAAQSPRGLESVTFKARVAQAVDFDDVSYFMTDLTALKNYTFMAGAAFDINSRKNFAGNASLSLFAHYTPRVGCYELRVEQYDASVSATGVVSPGNTFRISLYRWNYDKDYGGMVPTLMGTPQDQASGNMFITTETSETAYDGNYDVMFISVDTTVSGETRVMGGVAQACAVRDDFLKSQLYRVVMCRDNSADRHKYGSYGLLSANCPARFVRPAYSATPVTYQTDKTGYQFGNYNIVPMTSSARQYCNVDMAAGRWAISEARMKSVNTDNDDKYSVNAVIPSTEVVVYTAPSGTVDWTPIATNTVSGFGSANSAGATTTIPLYSLDTCSVMIRAGGNARSARKDVTVDDIEFKQWRGEGYDDKGQGGVFDDVYYGAYTNIVFTQGWVSKGYDSAKKPRTTCLLSAKRSYSTVATSIRSPRMVSIDGEERGLGLGNLAFSWEDAQTNAYLCVQIATNSTALSGFADLTKSVSAADWTTVTNIDFSVMTAAERKEGSCRIYIGLHGVKGTMRIALDPARVAAICNPANTNTTAFGEVTITGVSFRDEPVLDKYSWWGWNLRTTDDKAMRIISDNTADGTKTGLSLGLNNSVTADVRTDVPEEQYTKKYPFVQTPTFATNLVNEVSFMARLYSTNDAMARVTLYGANSGDLSDETKWAPLKAWDVTNTTYEVYTKKFLASNSYMAFRLAVENVPGVTEKMPACDPLDPPCRVLIDEVLVMEGVSAAVSFRNVGAFRLGLEDTTAALNVPSKEQQPICGEQWGVQCEVFPSLLADEIDLSGARVRLWWYEGDAPWGFENWRNREGAKNAWLMEADDSNLVFRSSHFGASDAIMKAQDRFKVVQYMLEVIYRAGGQPQTNWLSSADWQTPSWYAPVDYNADYGGFSAYTILDTVAPGWAWINEANVFGEIQGMNYINSDKLLQFVEIAAPSEADLTDWSLRSIEAKLSAGSENVTVITNELATFGAPGGPPGTKKGLKGMDPSSKCVFHVIASPLAKASFDESDGQIDGTWKLPKNYQGSAFGGDGEQNASLPQCLQLMRPSGVVEHEIVFVGTNDYEGVEYEPTNHVAFLNKHERGGRWFFAGSDANGIPAGSAWSRSLGVFKNKGEEADDWNAVNLMTPGRINEGQVIDSQPPKPQGTAIVIYSFLLGGRLSQTFAGEVATRENLRLVYHKDSSESTNITYNVDRWHEIGEVTVNGAAATPTPTGNEREWTLAVGAGATDDITVIASAKVDQTLVDNPDYGLGPDNRYSNAIVDWLTRGTDAYGGKRPWHNPAATTLGLADQVKLDGTVVTNLTLTEMYWLDIDPTWDDGDIQLKADYTVAPHPVVVPATTDWPCHTNINMTMFMQITNTVNGDAWSPYILQGTELAGNSWAYTNVSANWRWTNATFKVTGRLLNGQTSEHNERNWIPLRWFVFTPGSFDANFESVIEVEDPFTLSSPGAAAGWAQWVKEHGPTTLGWGWDISDRSWLISADELKPDSTLP